MIWQSKKGGPARFDNVFVLSTGRCGSLTFHQACRYITNYTARHESANRVKERHAAVYAQPFPRRHIEIDNRLAWFLGLLERRYGDNAYYVHLLRDRDETARSLAKRRGIFRAFGGEMMHRQRHVFDELAEDAKYEVALNFWDTVTANIELFLKDKTHKTTAWIHDIEEPFYKFWTDIGADGRLDKALAQLGKRYHASG